MEYNHTDTSEIDSFFTDTTPSHSSAHDSIIDLHDSDSLVSSDKGIDSTSTSSFPLELKDALGFGFGAALIHSYPFILWQENLSYKRSDLTGYKKIPPHWAAVHDSVDSISLKFKERKKPESFNIAFPLVFYYYLSHTLHMQTSVFYLGKTYKGFLQPDTLRPSISVVHTCRFFDISHGLYYSAGIPPSLFSIDGADRVLFDVGLSLHPLALLATSSQLTSSNRSDSLWNNVKGTIPQWPQDIFSYSAGLSWSIGISTLRALSPAGAVRAGVSYTGTWYGFFLRSDGTRIRESHIPPRGQDAESIPLRFLSHAITIKFSFIRSR